MGCETWKFYIPDLGLYPFKKDSPVDLRMCRIWRPEKGEKDGSGSNC